ncbi:Calx-beta domain-containing protein [Planctomycetota bacterium]
MKTIRLLSACIMVSLCMVMLAACGGGGGGGGGAATTAVADGDEVVFAGLAFENALAKPVFAFDNPVGFGGESFSGVPATGVVVLSASGLELDRVAIGGNGAFNVSFDSDIIDDGDRLTITIENGGGQVQAQLVLMPLELAAGSRVTMNLEWRSNLVDSQNPGLDGLAVFATLPNGIDLTVDNAIDVDNNGTSDAVSALAIYGDNVVQFDGDMNGVFGEPGDIVLPGVPATLYDDDLDNGFQHNVNARSLSVASVQDAIRKMTLTYNPDEMVSDISDDFAALLEIMVYPRGDDSLLDAQIKIFSNNGDFGAANPFTIMIDPSDPRMQMHADGTVSIFLEHTLPAGTATTVTSRATYDLEDDGFPQFTGRLDIALPGGQLADPPSISSVDPDDGASSGGTSVTIQGQDFQDGIAVLFDGAPAQNVTYVNSTTVTCLTPPGSAGAVDVLVLNPDGQGDDSEDAFTYITPAVTITESGAATAITEGGATDTYDVVLTTKPAAQVTIDISSDLQADTDLNSLVFSTVNWATPQTVTVSAENDLIAEGNHTASITHAVTSLDMVYNSLTVSSVSAAVTDNDTAELSIDDVTVIEGDAGTQTAQFTVTMSLESSLTVTVDYATADGTATTADNDYETASGTVTFDPGQTSKSINVTINGDTDLEQNETYTVDISNAVNATITDNSGAGTITNDDGIMASIDDITLAEADAGITAFVFSVTLSEGSNQTITIDYTTTDGTATVADSDYTATAGTLTFDPWDVSETVTVNANGDTGHEAAETFTVDLSNITGANVMILDDQGTGTISNDDTVTAAISDAILTEGSSGTRIFTFAVTLAAAAGNTMSVDYTTTDGIATVADNDYTATSGTLTFTPGDISKDILVSITSDTVSEIDETFTVDLSNPTGGYISIADIQGVGMIRNDDALGLNIDDVTDYETHLGTTTFTFTVSPNLVIGQTITVDYATNDGTATLADTDYTAAAATLTFNPGDTTKTIVVNVTGDLTDENDETFTIDLSNATGQDVSISDSQGVGTITNDDDDIRLDTSVPAVGTSENLQVCSNGPNVFAVWQDDRNGAYDIYLNYSTDGGATWQGESRLDDGVAGQAESTNPQICCEGPYVYVIWQDDRNADWDIFSNYSDDSGASWQGAARIDNDLSLSDARNPQICCEGPYVYAVWEDDRAAGEIYSNYSYAGTWQGADIRVDNGTGGDSPKICCAGARVYVTWLDDSAGAGDIVTFNYSIDNGASFQGADITLSGEVRLPAEICSAGADVYAVWSNNGNGIEFSYSNNGGATWTGPATLDANGSSPKICCSGSNAYITWLETDIRFNYSINRGVSFVGESRIDSSTGNPSSPQICSQGTNVFIAWQDDRNGNDDIYYNYSTDSGSNWQGIDIRCDTDAPGQANSQNPRISSSGPDMNIIWQDDRSANIDIYQSRKTVVAFQAQPLALDERLDTDNPGAGSSDNPQICSEGSYVYAVWQDDRNVNYDIYFNYSTDGGLTWQGEQRIDNGAGPDVEIAPQISCSGSYVYAIWERSNTSDIYFNRSSDNGQTWSGVDTLLDNGSCQYQQICSSGTNVYAAWDDNNNLEVKYSTDNGANWSAPVTAFATTDIFSFDMCCSGTNVYISCPLWIGNPFPLILQTLPVTKFNHSTDGGATWEGEVFLSSPLSFQSKICCVGSNVYVVWERGFLECNTSEDAGNSWEGAKNVGAGSSGMQICAAGSNVYITWSWFNGILFNRSIDSGANWVGGVNLDAGGVNSNPDISCSGTNVYAIWEDNTPSIQFNYSTDNGVTWAGATQLDQGLGTGDIPKISSSGSNVSGVWEDDRNGNKDIYSQTVK